MKVIILTPFKVFISYPDEDKQYATGLKAFLELMMIDAYMAEHDKRAGDRLPDKIYPEIENSDCVVVLYTTNATRSEWMKREIITAKNLKRVVIPVVETGVTLDPLLADADVERITFSRDKPCGTTYKICFNILKRRESTPHVIFLTQGDRYNPASNRLILMPATGKAYYMGKITDSLVKKGTLRFTCLSGVENTFRQTMNSKVWAYLMGYELVPEEPTLEELGIQI